MPPEHEAAPPALQGPPPAELYPINDGYEAWPSSGPELRPVELRVALPAFAARVIRKARELIDPMVPLMSVGDLRAMPMWAALTRLQKDQLDVLVSAQDRVGSLSRFALGNLFDEATYKEATPEAQAAQVFRVLSETPALPGNVALAIAFSDVTLKQGKYALEEPKLVDYEFRTKLAPAKAYALSVGERMITLYEPADLQYAEPHQQSVEGVAKALAMVPPPLLDAISTVTLSPDGNPDDARWAKEHGQGATTFMSIRPDTGAVTVYPTKTANDPKYLMQNFAHEAGHGWSMNEWGADSKDPRWDRWRQAMADDGLPVSGYAKASPNEDVAETTALYLMSRGTTRFAFYQRLYPNRFAILEERFGPRSEPKPLPPARQVEPAETATPKPEEPTKVQAPDGDVERDRHEVR